MLFSRAPIKVSPARVGVLRASNTTKTSMPPKSSRTSGSQGASRNAPATPITVMPPQMIQCSGVNGMQTPHKICKPTHKITKVQIVPTMSVGISNA